MFYDRSGPGSPPLTVSGSRFIKMGVNPVIALESLGCKSYRQFWIYCRTVSMLTLSIEPAKYPSDQNVCSFQNCLLRYVRCSHHKTRVVDCFRRLTTWLIEKLCDRSIIVCKSSSSISISEMEASDLAAMPSNDCMSVVGMSCVSMALRYFTTKMI